MPPGPRRWPSPSNVPPSTSRSAATRGEWWQRVRGGELGSLPIIVALIVIAIVFGALDDTFLTERNFTNLLLQMAAVATLAIGIVFVLLIGEIDLSIAYVSAVGGVVMTLLIRTGDPGWPWWLAILAAVTVTTIIGLLQAIVITKAGVPSFVVTLAGLADLVRRRAHPHDPGFDDGQHPDLGADHRRASRTRS